MTDFARIDRALSQRIHLLQRNDAGTRFAVQGTTGAHYEVLLDYARGFCTCDCQDALIRGHRCKHILFVLLKVLRLPSNHVLYSRLGYHDSDINRALREVAGTRARPDSTVVAVATVAARRPYAGLDCGICFDEMDDAEDGKENIVYCETGCGQSVHGACMAKWLLKNETCVYCRARWWN